MSSEQEPVHHIDRLAYAVSLLDGAARIAATGRDQPISKFGIPFHLLIGFSIENGLKALLDFQNTSGQWRKSHDLAALLEKTKNLTEILLPGATEDIIRLSRYHKEHWFRYPEKALVADVPKAQTTLILTDHLLRKVSALVGYRP